MRKDVSEVRTVMLNEGMDARVWARLREFARRDHATIPWEIWRAIRFMLLVEDGEAELYLVMPDGSGTRRIEMPSQLAPLET